MAEAALPRVELLGPVQIRSEHGCDAVEKPTAASMLARLVLVNGAPVSIGQLQRYQRQGGSQSTTMSHLAYLRSLLQRHGVEIPRKTQAGYCVPKDSVTVDVFEFIDGVNGLPDNGDPERMSQLYALWRGEPGAELPAPFADRIPKAYRRLAEITVRCQERGDTLAGADAYLLNAPAEQAEDSPARRQAPRADRQPASAPRARPAAAAAADQHPPESAHNRRLPASSAPQPGRAASAKQRVLIVEDDPICIKNYQNRLEEDFDCVFVEDIQEWRRIVAAGPLDFDAAIIDRCLTVENDDEDGYDVLLDLRGSSFAKALVTANAVLYDNDVDFKLKYDIDLIFPKNPYGREEMPKPRTIVHRLLSIRRPTRLVATAPDPRVMGPGGAPADEPAEA